MDPSKDSLVLDGMLEGRTYHAEAKLFDRNRFPIINRGPGTIGALKLEFGCASRRRHERGRFRGGRR